MRSLLPMASSTGRARSNAAWSPPAMIDSEALIAPISPPLTGASSIVAPFSATIFASRWVATGEMLLMSITIAPRCTVDSTPSAAVITSSTSGVSGTIVMMMVAWRATSAGDVAAFAPAPTTSSTAPRLRLYTTRECPPLMRFFAMGLPMTPSPMNPIVSAIEGYNPTEGLVMKRAVVAAALLGLSASPLAAGGPGHHSVSGAYVEARTAEVFTGGCIMNSEAETMGKQAVLAWKVDRGSFNGVRIDGLSVVAAVVGDRNLGIQEIGGGKAATRSAMYVDSRTHAAQQIALVAMANELSKGLVGTIVQVTAAPIQFADHGSEIQVSAGPASLDVNKHLTHDPTCGAMQWFHPLASVDDAAVGVASQHIFTG